MQGLDAATVLSAGSRLGRVRRVQMEVPLGDGADTINVGAITCADAVRKMRARGFVLATPDEIGEYASFGSHDSPMVYEGSQYGCEGSPEFREADVFFIRSDLTRRRPGEPLPKWDRHSPVPNYDYWKKPQPQPVWLPSEAAAAAVRHHRGGAGGREGGRGGGAPSSSSSPTRRSNLLSWLG